MGSRARGLCSLWHAGSLVEVCELSSCVCGLSCPVACGILVPRPRIELASPALEADSFFKNFIYYLFIYLSIYLSVCLFIYLFMRWVFVAARGLSVVAVSGGYSSSQCMGFSLRWLLIVEHGL